MSNPENQSPEPVKKKDPKVWKVVIGVAWVVAMLLLGNWLAYRLPSWVPPFIRPDPSFYGSTNARIVGSFTAVFMFVTSLAIYWLYRVLSHKSKTTNNVFKYEFYEPIRSSYQANSIMMSAFAWGAFYPGMVLFAGLITLIILAIPVALLVSLVGIKFDSSWGMAVICFTLAFAITVEAIIIARHLKKWLKKQREKLIAPATSKP